MVAQMLRPYIIYRVRGVITHESANSILEFLAGKGGEGIHDLVCSTASLNS